MIDLGYVLRAAWRMSWRHKRLWLLGLAASLGVVGLRASLASPTVWERAASELPAEAGDALLRFLDSPYIAVLVVVAVLLLVAGALGLTMLNAVGRAALVDQVRVAEERGAVTIPSGWDEGKRRLWPVLQLRLTLGLPSLLATGSLVLVFVLGAIPRWVVGVWPAERLQRYMLTVALSSACLVPIAIVLWLISVPLNPLLRIAVRACVLEGYGVRESIRRAWATARQHWTVIILLWLAQSAGTVAALVVLGLPLLLGAVVLSTAAVAVGVVSLLWSIGLTALVGLIGWLAGGFLGGVIETFVSAMWTLAYREMHGLGLTGE